MFKHAWLHCAFATLLVVVAVGCKRDQGTAGAGPTTEVKPGETPEPKPEPWPASTADLPQTSSRLLDGMDNGVELTDAERKGRNTWILWTAGNEHFWNYLANHSFGLLDFLKTLSIPRAERFARTGLINEPGFKAPDGPDQYGLLLDVWDGEPPADQPDPKVYGRSSGVIGLRIFDNPAFDEAAKKKWDARKFYADPFYYDDPDLVRPYVVGMSCGFCHVSFNPLKPPVDPTSPKYENLSANIGAEFFWVSRVFGKDMHEDNFVYQLMESSPPGALDTSLIASDNINGPRTMNAIFEVGGRLGVSEALGATEKVSGATMLVPGVKDGVPGVQKGVNPAGALYTPHVLKDGADSVGLAGALSRVFINIGEFHEEWVKHFTPLIGGKQTPMSVARANENSVYWNATAERLPNLAAFFIKTAGPMHLTDAPGGDRYLTESDATVTRGKKVFAEHCAVCHSSKQPPVPEGLINRGYFDADWEKWVASKAYKDWMAAKVLKDDFVEGNFFSTDMRFPVTLIGTNACSPVASNAIKGHVWESFSSDTYKSLPPAGTVDVANPIDGSRRPWTLPGGGRGYVRAPSLVSVWTSAPFFQNNALGALEYDADAHGAYVHKRDAASVDTRVRVFQDAIEQLLWLKERDRDPYLGDKGVYKIYRTSAESYLRVSVGALPQGVREGLKLLGKDEIKIGPIPKGTPINLLSNIDLAAGEADSDAKKADLVKALAGLSAKLLKIKVLKLDERKTIEQLEKIVPDLLEVNKCPDFEVNRGHDFGKTLKVADKRALVAFLKRI